jgi:hypothetical protein
VLDKSIIVSNHSLPPLIRGDALRRGQGGFLSSMRGDIPRRQWEYNSESIKRIKKFKLNVGI